MFLYSIRLLGENYNFFTFESLLHMSIYDSGNYIHTHLHLLKKLPNSTARDEIRIMDFQINAAAYMALEEEKRGV